MGVWRKKSGNDGGCGEDFLLVMAVDIHKRRRYRAEKNDARARVGVI